MKIVVEINIPLDGAHWADIPGLYFKTTQKIWSITKLHQMRRESFFCNLATTTWRCISFYRYEFCIWIYVKQEKIYKNEYDPGKSTQWALSIGIIILITIVVGHFL
jgi:hypothetical protein